MLIPNHPHDERLSALASGDPEAVADSVLSEHVSSCHRCTDTVAELGALRASLADLPDLRPHRPLQLLPPVIDPAPSRVDRAGGWARRFFAPVLTAGAALALVGLIGTTAPFDGLASQAGGAADMYEMAPDATNERLSLDGVGTTGAAETEGGESGDDTSAARPLATQAEGRTLDTTSSDGDQETTPVPLERSVWPMVLFTGIALMVAAALLRWILAPRPG
jgi:hypothetical protein